MHRPFRSSPPKPGPFTFARPRLTALLGRRWEHRLVTVEAGAGFGKTTLLAQAVLENAMSPRGRDVWLTCAPADSSASELTFALLDGLGRTPSSRELATVDGVCEAVWAAAPERVCLVLDDAHLIEADSSGAETLTRLLEDLPANGHLVVAARVLPSMRSARLLALGETLELGQAELRLDQTEEEQLAELHNIPLSVLKDVGGWPALAELRARAGVAGSDRFVREEVLNALSSDDRHAFALFVAVGGGDAELLAAATGALGDAERMKRLARLPLVHRDGQGSLQPHPLWEDLLRDALQPDDIARARIRVAEALRARQDYGQAFELLAMAGAWDVALDVLFDACNDQRRPPWRDVLERWRRRLHADLAERPEVIYLDAMIERSHDPWSEAGDQAFRRSVEAFRALGNIARELGALVRWSYSVWVRNDRATMLEMRERGNQLALLVPSVRAILKLNSDVVADIDGVAADGEPVEGAGTLEPRLRHFPHLYRSFALLREGDADAATSGAAECAAAAAQVQPAAGTGYAALLPTAVAWARGDLDAARSSATLDLGPRFNLAERIPPLAMSAVIAAHHGDGETARQRAADIDRLVPDVGGRDLVAGFAAVADAAAAIALGDENGARSVLAARLGDRPLSPAGAGRALLWFPSIPYLFNDRAREMLDARSSGPSRTRTLDACRALLGARAGSRPGRVALLDSPSALLTALPVGLAIELCLHAMIANDQRGLGAARGLVELVPGPSRHHLHLLSERGAAPIRRAAVAVLAAVPIPPPHRLRIEVLGSARLLRNGALVDDPTWRRERVRQVVCALAAFRELRRTRLGALLWPEFDEEGVSANLRTTLSYVQGLFEPHRGRRDAPWFLQQDGGILRLEASDYLSVDVWEFDELLRGAAEAHVAGTPTRELELLMDAIVLWRGDYLDDVAGELWAEPLREQMRARFVHGAVRAGELLVAAGRTAEAIDVAGRILEVDAWSEAAYRVIIRTQLAMGDQAGAQRALGACRRMLEDLGADLDPSTEALANSAR